MLMCKDCEKVSITQKQYDELKRKAAILDELIELRGMATRGMLEFRDEGRFANPEKLIAGTIVTHTQEMETFNLIAEIFKSGNSKGNAKAITEIMNRLEELK